MKPNKQHSSKKLENKTTLLDVSISKQGIVIQAAVAHSIERRKDAKWLCIYMHIFTEGKVYTLMKTHFNALLAHVLAFCTNNVGRFPTTHANTG